MKRLEESPNIINTIKLHDISKRSEVYIDGFDIINNTPFDFDYIILSKPIQYKLKQNTVKKALDRLVTVSTPQHTSNTIKGVLFDYNKIGKTTMFFLDVDGMEESCKIQFNRYSNNIRISLHLNT